MFGNIRKLSRLLRKRSGDSMGMVPRCIFGARRLYDTPQSEAWLIFSELRIENGERLQLNQHVNAMIAYYYFALINLVIDLVYFFHANLYLSLVACRPHIFSAMEDTSLEQLRACI